MAMKLLAWGVFVSLIYLIAAAVMVKREGRLHKRDKRNNERWEQRGPEDGD